MIYFTAHTFKCVCHCRRAMFRVLGMYNFGLCKNFLAKRERISSCISEKIWWQGRHMSVQFKGSSFYSVANLKNIRNWIQLSFSMCNQRIIFKIKWYSETNVRMFLENMFSALFSAIFFRCFFSIFVYISPNIFIEYMIQNVKFHV